MNPDYYDKFSDRQPTRSFPNAVKVGPKVIYKGKDATVWLAKQTDRNIKATARLVYQNQT